MIIMQVKSSSVYHIAVQVENLCLKAVVDTAAEATIISDKVFNNLVPKPPIINLFAE